MYNLQIKGRSETLSEVAKEVNHGEDLDELITAMWSIMKHHKGIGIAANQVGSLKRVIIIAVNGFVTEIINPKIIKLSGKTKLSTEGCLSVPNKKVKVKRDNIVIVEGFDRNWQPIKKKVRALQSFCVQHEIDHLNGVCI